MFSFSERPLPCMKLYYPGVFPNMKFLDAPQSGAVYFKIRLQYKRLLTNDAVETFGDRCVLASTFLKHCFATREILSMPDRVLTGKCFTFTATDFRLSDSHQIRLCEAKFEEHTSGVLILLDDQDRPASLDDWSYSSHRERPVKFDHQASSYSLRDTPSKAEDRPALQCLDEYEYFALVLLCQEHAAKRPCPAIGQYCTSEYSPRILILFEDMLLSRHPVEDRWTGTTSSPNGSSRFLNAVSYFVERGLPVHFVLPAFPCKSTNPRKTHGTLPDGAEHEAFTHLHRFCIALQEIYPPGADFTVVSDGHVFSDCIGTHDPDVYTYTDAIKEMSTDIHKNLAKTTFGSRSRYVPSPIRFLNLHEVFHPRAADLLELFNGSDWNKYHLNNPIKSVIIDPDDDTCRKMMIRSCAFDPVILEKVTKDYPNHSITNTMRGFKRFMEKDLAVCREMLDATTSKQQANFAERVAKEMIKRNQAYSHLVELVHPVAVRISIHQHKNHGPKYAISVFPKHRFRPVRSLKAEALWSIADAVEDDKVGSAHIPTPWHNVLVEIEGHQMTYICESGVVEDELESAGMYSKDSGYDKERGRYVLRHP